MNKLFVLLAVCLLVGSASADINFADIPGGTQPNPPVEPVTVPAVDHQLTLTFYNDQAAFDADWPGLPCEDWSGTNVPDFSVMACDGPFDENTNNGCFSPGFIIPGIQMDNLNVAEGGLNVVLGRFFLGNNVVLVGPNTFDHDAVMRFSPAVAAVGFYIACPFGPFPTHMDVYDAGGVLLGSTDIPSCGTIDGDFFGVSSDADPIGSLEFFAGAGNGELYGQVCFGGEGPTATENVTWGSIKSLYK